MRRHWSVSRMYLTAWILGLAFALILGLSLRALPALLNLNQFRPQITKILENACHCHVLLGNVRGELVPYPGLVVGHVVLLQQSTPPRVIGAVDGVHLWFSIRTLWEGRLCFKTVRFWHPRFMVHRERVDPGDKAWTFFNLSTPAKTGTPEKEDDTVNTWQIREGRLEIWDHTTTPTSKWTVQSLSGDFNIPEKKGAVAGKAQCLGSHAIVDIHYEGAADFPITARLTDIELGVLPAFVHAQVAALKGTASFIIKIRLTPALVVQTTLEPVILPSVAGLHLRGDASYTADHFRMHLQTGTTVAAMTVTAEGMFSKDHWKLQAIVDGYDARLMRAFYRQPWVDRLEGPGSIIFAAQSGRHPGTWGWTATGQHFLLEGSAFQLPEWSAQGDTQGMSVNVQATTAQDGSAEVTWSQSAKSKTALLSLSFSSVTVHQMLEIFNLQGKHAYGYEPWIISDASVEAAIDEGKTLTVQEASVDVAGLHLDLTGDFGLLPANARAHIRGDLDHVPVDRTLESFVAPPAPLSGTGRAGFDLTFPLSSQWIQGMNGTLNVESDHGVLRILKTMYRIMSVLNLGNYLRLRFPQVTAKGIEFDAMTGHFMFQNGVISTEDLFFKSPNMNVGVRGSVDIPAKQVKATLRLEMFRFLEDILRDVPLTHWIFKKPSKIFLPLVVTLSGPWDNLDVK